uniref:NADH dehydrogenase subunit 6 n=1 Tax=Apis dorsata TaxID=7462 RepID=A0A0A0N2V9_APIDO|nr:NADH dehydrogenase subunit 6 [Apis dorsata]
MMTMIMMFMNLISSSIIFMISSIYLNMIFNNSMLLLIYLIIYSIYLSIMMYISCPMNSLFILMIMIVFLSGMLVMFSYFISLVNYPFKLKFNMIYQLLFFFVLMSMMFYKNLLYTHIPIVKLFPNMIKNSDMYMLYSNISPSLFSIIIIMLISSLILMTKISYIENKTLRKKK